MRLLFDIGATNTRLALDAAGKSQLGQVVIFKTPKKFSEAIKEISRQAKKLAGEDKITSAAGGVAGALAEDKENLISSNLRDWVNRPLKSQLRKVLSSEISIENDAALAGLGEARFGAGRGFDIVAYITVGSGVGGSRIINGKIDDNFLGFEPGHQMIQVSGRTVCLEDLVSGLALERQTKKKPETIKSAKVWNQLAKTLAIGLNNTIVHWSPDVVVFGGSMMLKNPGISLDLVTEHLKKINHVFGGHLPVIKKAQLGDLGGLYGAKQM